MGDIMKLVKVKIKNFRSYQNEIELNFNEITTLIGKNDIGKSTILEALEIFFNNSTVKIGSKDANVKLEDKKVVISCVFSDFPKGKDSIVLDASNKTSLEEEYLLNKDCLLEIQKVYNCGLKSPSEEIFIKAYHPKLPFDKFLIQNTSANLKKIIKELKIDEDLISDKRINAEYRRAIFQHFKDAVFETQDIKLNDNESKSVWEKLKLEMPIYSLFQADRSSNDGDSEVQDPMKLAVKEALADAEKDLETLKNRIVKQTMDVAKATISKLHEMDASLAESLIPQFTEEPKWGQIFKFSLEDSEGIPINKKGSGVRRLILLNFFRAASERKLEEGNKKQIIYAIEEPETAQHPNNQKMLAEAFIKLALKDNVQVILTTHVPNFAGLMPTESIRFIDVIENEKIIKDANFDENVLTDVSDALGMIPSPIDAEKVKVAIVVEGPTDISALKHFSEIVSARNTEIVDLNNNEEVVFIISGGSTLKYWVTNQYLKALGIPELHLVDRDDKEPPQYQRYCEVINSRGDGSKAFMTRKREIENYIYPKHIKDHFGITHDFEVEDFTDVPDIIKNFNGMKHATAKGILNSVVIEKMTYEELKEMDIYNEVEELWLKSISEYVKKGEAVLL